VAPLLEARHKAPHALALHPELPLEDLPFQARVLTPRFLDRPSNLLVLLVVDHLPEDPLVPLLEVPLLAVRPREVVRAETHHPREQRRLPLAQVPPPSLLLPRHLPLNSAGLLLNAYAVLI
jgi:hypothetical protein